jgi:hypothetical protein
MDNSDSAIFSAMQAGNPYATYRKTILAKVYINILNPFSGNPEGIILYGDPKNDESGRIDTWSEKEDLFLRRMNKNHFARGTLLKIERETPVEVRTIEQYSDAELAELLRLKYYSLQRQLSEIESAPVLMRLIAIARDEEKSEKIIKTLEARLSEVELKQPPTVS